MNEFYYETLIKQFLNNKDKKILRKKDCYLLTYHYSETKKKLLLYIFLHLGYPCIKRYCSCKYYNYEDILFAKLKMY